MLTMKCSVCRVLHSGVLPRRYVLVRKFDFSVAVLSPNQYYPGRCELWYNQHATELFQLSEASRKGFVDELNVLTQAIYNAFKPQKLNYEILGNTVPHLHCHLIPRYSWDPLPKRPIWENQQYKAVERQYCMSIREKADIAARIAQAIQEIRLQSA